METRDRTFESSQLDVSYTIDDLNKAIEKYVKERYPKYKCPYSAFFFEVSCDNAVMLPGIGDVIHEDNCLCADWEVVRIIDENDNERWFKRDGLMHEGVGSTVEVESNPEIMTRTISDAYWVEKSRFT